MTIETTREGILRLLTQRLPATFVDKSARYGNAWWSEAGGVDAVLLQFAEVHAKFYRLKKMVWQDECADKAACAETYLDQALYSVMSAAMLIDSMTEEEVARLTRKQEA